MPDFLVSLKGDLVSRFQLQSLTHALLRPDWATPRLWQALNQRAAMGLAAAPAGRVAASAMAAASHLAMQE
jgi:hypothetical protein